MRKIIKAGIGYRALAAIIDAFLMVFLAFGIFALAQTCFLSTSYAKSLQADLLSYQVDSGLYYEDDSGNPASYDDYSSYDSYQDMLVHYYTVYLASDCYDKGECLESETHKEYDIYWYNVFVLGLDDEQGSFEASDLSARLEPTSTLGTTYWSYQKDSSGNSIYDKLAIPSASMHVDNDSTKALSDDGKAKLLAFYYSSDQRSVYYTAGQNLFATAFFQRTYKSYTQIDTGYPLVIGASISLLVIYLVLPLCFKDGATFGKKMLHLCLINKLEFSVTKSQIVLRQLPTILFASIILYFANFNIAVMVISIVIFLSYLLSIFDKDHRAVHDFIAGTLVIDAKDSLFFSSIQAEEAAQKTYDSAMNEATNLVKDGESQVDEEKKNHNLL